MQQYRRGTLRGVRHIGCLHVVAAALPQFVQREPQHLRSAITRDELDKLPVVLSGCMSSLHKCRQVEDAKRIRSIGSYCSPAVLGRFVCSETFEDARREIEACERAVDRRTVGAFCMIRNVLMLAAGIMNARRTGDLCNMTLNEFSNARPSRARQADHIVHVLRHKTASSKPCKVNFYNRLYKLTYRYVNLFRSQFLEVAEPDGRAVCRGPGNALPHDSQPLP